MQKNEFEKNVQRKMEELKIQPSASVWQNIEANVSKRKRRALAWIFFPVILMFLFGAYKLFYVNNGEKKNQDFSKTIINTDSNNKKNNDLEGNTSKNDLGELHAKNNSEENIDIVKREKESLPGMKNKWDNNQSISNENSVDNKSEATVNDKPAKENSGENLNNKIAVNNDKPGENKSGISNTTGDLHKANITTTLEDIKKDTVVNAIDSSINSVTINAKKENNFFNNSRSKKILAKTIKPKRDRKLWQFGFTFSAGISGIPNKFLGSLSPSQDKSYDPNSSSAGNPGGPANLTPPPAGIKSSAGFVAGITVERPVIKNLKIGLGLNYKIYSTTIKTGERNEILQTFSLSDPQNQYRNYYHFIEVPLSVSLQLISKKVPVFFNTGLLLSQLVSSNALQLNSNQTAYYVDNSLFNKSQLGLNAGFAVSIFSHTHSDLLIGPDVYYSITKAAKGGLYKGQHFSFIGLRSHIVFKK